MSTPPSEPRRAHPGNDDEPLSEHQALMMAYVDDELPQEARRRFEKLLAEDRTLACEVADYQNLLDMGRAAATLEPTDRELRRFWGRFHNRAEWRLGWTLLLGGIAVLLGFGVYEVIVSTTLPGVFKVAVLCTIAGGAILGSSLLRQRSGQARLDRYRGVVR